ncbi:translation initiation factor Sui1 [bacterium]|nr:translation initiation factor Sui1 [bacterium]
MKSDLVYSTALGKMCPKCEKPIKSCSCKQKKQEPKSNNRVRVCRETKGRKGKGVSLITGLPLNQTELQKLAKELKKRFGCGGTVRNGVIEIQGNHRDLILLELEKRGYDAKKSGG